MSDLDAIDRMDVNADFVIIRSGDAHERICRSRQAAGRNKGFAKDNCSYAPYGCVPAVEQVRIDALVAGIIMLGNLVE